MSDKYIKKFYEEVCENLGQNYKIILEPKRGLKEEWIELDCVNWEMEDNIKDFVNNVVKKSNITLEDKIIKIYEYICLNYIYDANVLYFFKKDLSDPNSVKYIAVDWYGRIIGNSWYEKRKSHNRRICYEFARFYAKAINELIDQNMDLEAFMLGDKDNLHYVVGLAGTDYSVVLDLDDFNSLKDLTRLKLGLTIKGINILRDKEEKFKKAVDNFNKDKLEEVPEIEEANRKLKSKNFIDFLKTVADILRNNNIDSQGFFEFIRGLIEKENIEIEKLWKEVYGAEEKRYERCIIFNYNSKTYLLDSVDKTLENINTKEDLNKKFFIFNSEENEYPYYGG